MRTTGDTAGRTRRAGMTKRLLAGGALVLAGFGAGAAIAVTGSASAATDAVSSGVSSAVGGGTENLDPSRSIRSDEHLLSGTTARKVRAAALARYPGATIQRVETDSDGVYEVHVVTSAGKQVVVQVGKDFQVTGTQSWGAGGGPGRGDGDGDGPRAGTAAGPSAGSPGA